MDQMFEDTAESTDKISKELDEAAKNSKELEGSAKAALEESEKQTEEAKKKKAQDDENLRIAQNQLETFKSITGELELGRDELQTQLGLQNDLLTASENERDVISAVADLESQRKDALIDLNSLTTNWC